MISLDFTRRNSYFILYQFPLRLIILFFIRLLYLCSTKTSWFQISLSECASRTYFWNSLFCRFCENFWPNMKCCKVYISGLRRSCHSLSRSRTPARFLMILCYKLPCSKDCFHIINLALFLQSDCLLQLKLLVFEFTSFISTLVLLQCKSGKAGLIKRTQRKLKAL